MPEGGLHLTGDFPTSFQLVDSTVPFDSCSALGMSSSTGTVNSLCASENHCHTVQADPRMQ